MQWCVVAPDLDEACARLEAVYGVPGFYVLEPAPLRNVTLRGEPIDLRVDMALGYLGDVNVEVLTPRDDGDDNIYTEFLWFDESSQTTMEAIRRGDERALRG